MFSFVSGGNEVEAAEDRRRQARGLMLGLQALPNVASPERNGRKARDNEGLAIERLLVEAGGRDEEEKRRPRTAPLFSATGLGPGWGWDREEGGRRRSGESVETLPRYSEKDESRRSDERTELERRTLATDRRIKDDLVQLSII
ncbi:hypothetical protein RQP46_011476 [Phenoliferia psychrophenolica]